MNDPVKTSQTPELAVETRQPFDLSDEMKHRVTELDLWPAVRQVEQDGYGYIYQPAPLVFTEQLRETILRACTDASGARGVSANMLLAKDPIFAEVVLNSKILTLVEILCGKGALLSQLLGSIMERSVTGGLGGLHADQNWIPAPFPVHNQIATFCWACDEFTEAAGATRVIPGSQLHRRHPTPEESAAGEGVISTACPAGTIVFWDGAVWHDGGTRSLEGERVVLHINFSRLALRTVENYNFLDEDWLADKPYEMRVMLGREDFLGKPGGVSGLDNRILQTMNWGKT